MAKKEKQAAPVQDTRTEEEKLADSLDTIELK